MLLCSKGSIEDISVNDCDQFPYFPRPEDEDWKAEMLNQFIEEKDRGCLDKEEIEWLDYLCTS